MGASRGFDPAPFFIAGAVAIMVGFPLAAARTEAVAPLLAKCPTALGIFTLDAHYLNPFFTCFVGLLIILAVPGVIGVFLITYNSGR